MIFFEFIFVIGLIASIIAIIAGIFHDEQVKERREQELRAAKEEHERQKQLKQLYKQSPSEYFSSILRTELLTTIYEKVLHDDYSCVPNIETILKDGVLGITSKMPTKNEVSHVKETYYLKNGERRQKLWSARDFPKVYDDYLYKLCLHIVNCAFNSDPENIVSSILFNGYITDYSPTTGHLESQTIMSMLVNREQFEEIDVEHIDAKACFKHLKGISAAKLIDISPITPILTFDKEDSRFIENKNIEIGSGTNIASMNWEDFEQLVRLLFELEFSSNGSEVRVTQASRDGGVDAIIFNPDPLRGGKIVVQAKRYTNTVGVSAVRDLYGTVINEGANSGILITTSDYGHDSYEFAKDKPLKLLNSGHLLSLLHKNGIEGYINITEAKKNIKEA